MRHWLAIALLTLSASARAEEPTDEFPDGFFWVCNAMMDGESGRFSGSLSVDEGSPPAISEIEWTSARSFEGVDYGPKVTLTVSASWLPFGEESPFDTGNLTLAFTSEKKLPRFGYLDSGEGPYGGTFVTQFYRDSKDKKRATAMLRLRALKRWADDDEILPWRMQGGEDGVGSGKWVTSGGLSLAFLPALEAEYKRFEVLLLAKAEHPEKECVKAGYSNEIII